MKTLKTLSLTLVIGLGLSLAAQAQAVSASADIITSVTYAVGNTVDFGTLAQDFGTATLDPTGTGGDSGVNGTAGTDYNAGRIDISGEASQTITATLDNASVTLNHGTSTDVLTMSITLSQATASSTADRGGASFTSGNTVSLDASGNATIWIGGSLSGIDNDSGGLATGAYSNTTDLTFTLDYSF